ncbi:MAG TPA: DUF6320 domain-containing protein [Atopostipes sp.]|nr:DUF6320 domain-containing protein [Atopostipes sp.]
MDYCENCKASIKGDWEICPLCQTSMKQENSEDKKTGTSFLNDPLLFNRDQAKQTFFRVSLLLILLYFIAQIFYPFKFFGLEYILFGLFITWTLGIIFVRKRRNLAKVITYYLLLISLATIYFDYLFGWRGWSITFVVPIISMSALLAIFIAMQVINLKVQDYVLYLQLAALFGLIPLLFLIMNWVGHPLPSLLSVILSIIMFIGVLIRYRKLLIRELQKRMHI